MGAWDIGTFDNDAAGDWAGELEGQLDTNFLSATFAKVIGTGTEYLDSDIASEGLAAAEVVARLRGNWGVRNVYSETVDNWVESHPSQPSAELVEQAISVIDRVMTPPSEILELWSETNDFNRWRDQVTDLKQRVAA